MSPDNVTGHVPAGTLRRAAQKAPTKPRKRNGASLLLCTSARQGRKRAVKLALFPTKKKHTKPTEKERRDLWPLMFAASAGAEVVDAKGANIFANY